jgi:hypothetical protein
VDPPVSFVSGVYLALLDRLLNRRIRPSEHAAARRAFRDLGGEHRTGPKRDTFQPAHKTNKARQQWIVGKGYMYLNRRDERELGAWIALVLKERIDGY